MQQQHRLRRNGQFAYVYRRGKRASLSSMSLICVKSQQKRVGFSVSKKVGCAVVRNRVKRRLRECVRPMLPYMKNGLYVIVARPQSAELPYVKLKADVEALIRRLDVQKSDSKRVSGGQ